ncbi:hypothetical protein LXL04_024002 [Taraxacum kok-saghyz]
MQFRRACSAKPPHFAVKIIPISQIMKKFEFLLRNGVVSQSMLCEIAFLLRNVFFLRNEITIMPFRRAPSAKSSFLCEMDGYLRNAIWWKAFVESGYFENMAPYPPCESQSDLCRKEWPELLGVAEKEACLAIEKSDPTVRAIPLLISDFHIEDYCCNRVWVFVDKHDGVVVRVPRAG